MDLDATLRAYLAAQSALVAACATRISVDVDLPAGYQVGQGPALLLTNLGGRLNPTGVLLTTVYTAQCYAADAGAARTLDQILVTALHERAFGGVRAALLQVTGRLIRTPQTGWPIVVSSYQIISVF